MRQLFIAISTFLFLAAPAFAETSNNPITGPVCDTPYALCTSARCIPDPSAPDTQAICTCEVTQGPNYATVPCADRYPATVENNTVRILSTYSFVQAPTKPVLSCPEGEAWTDCLNQPCTVDPTDPTKAICTCPIKTTKSFVTYGGDCNTLTCGNAFWSAATLKDFDAGSEALMDVMGLEEEPYTFCPTPNK